MLVRLTDSEKFLLGSQSEEIFCSVKVASHEWRSALFIKLVSRLNDGFEKLLPRFWLMEAFSKNGYNDRWLSPHTELTFARNPSRERLYFPRAKFFSI